MSKDKVVTPASPTVEQMIAEIKRDCPNATCYCVDNKVWYVRIEDEGDSYVLGSGTTADAAWRDAYALKPTSYVPPAPHCSGCEDDKRNPAGKDGHTHSEGTVEHPAPPSALDVERGLLRAMSEDSKRQYTEPATPSVAPPQHVPTWPSDSGNYEPNFPQTREDGIREAARAQCYWCRDEDGRLNPIPIDRGADYTVRFWHAAKVGGFEAGDAHCDASKIWTLLLPTPPPQEGGKA